MGLGSPRKIRQRLDCTGDIRQRWAGVVVHRQFDTGVWHRGLPYNAKGPGAIFIAPGTALFFIERLQSQIGNGTLTE
jgi:hypothetical protein